MLFSYGDVQVISRTGNVADEISSSNESVNVIVAGDINGKVTALEHASASALGNITEDVTATNGNASAVASGGNITGKVDGGNSAYAFALENITGEVLGANDAVAYSFGNQTGNVSATFGNAAVITAGQLTGNVTAGRDAVVSAFDDITGSVTATNGSAAVFTWNGLSGSVSASNGDLFAFAGGSTAVSLTAGGDAFLQSLGSTTVSSTSVGGDLAVWSGGMLQGALSATGDVIAMSFANTNAMLSAGRDAFSFSLGDHGGVSISGGRDATLLSLGGVTGPSLVSATRDASVFALAGTSTLAVSGGRYGQLVSWGPALPIVSVTGPAGAVLWVNGDTMLTAVTSTNGPALATVIGNVTVQLNVSAGTDAVVTTTGAYNGSLNAGESALGLTLGGFAGGLLAGADGIIFSEGNIATTGFQAGSNAHLLAYGDIVGTYVAQRDASALAFGSFNATLNATRDVLFVRSVGDLLGSVTAGRDIGGGSLNMPALGGGQSLFSEGTINASMLAGRAIGSVGAWNDVAGSFSAGTSISDVTAGSNILATFSSTPSSLNPFDLAMQTAAGLGNTAAPVSIVPDILLAVNIAYTSIVAGKTDTTNAFDDVLDEYATAKTDTLNQLNTARSGIVTSNTTTATDASNKATTERTAFRQDLTDRQIAAALQQSNSVTSTNERRTQETETRNAKRTQYTTDAAAAVDSVAPQRNQLDDNDSTTTTDYDTQLRAARTVTVQEAADALTAWEESFKPWLTQQLEKFGEFVLDVDKDFKSKGYTSGYNGLVGEFVLRPVVGDERLIRRDIGNTTIAVYAAGKIYGLVSGWGTAVALGTEIYMDGANSLTDTHKLKELGFVGLLCFFPKLNWAVQGVSIATGLFNGAKQVVGSINDMRANGANVDNIRQFLTGAFQLAEAVGRPRPQCFASVTAMHFQPFDDDDVVLAVNADPAWRVALTPLSDDTDYSTLAIFIGGLCLTLWLRRRRDERREEISEFRELDAHFEPSRFKELCRDLDA